MGSLVVVASHSGGQTKVQSEGIHEPVDGISAFLSKDNLLFGGLNSLFSEVGGSDDISLKNVSRVLSSFGNLGFG